MTIISLVSVVKIIHWLLILFIVAIPFTYNEFLLTLHTIVIPGIVMHWLTNNNICSLTFLESKLSGVSVDKTFISRILFPFFEIDNKFMYCGIILLWLLTLWKLYPTGFRLLKLAFSVMYTLIMSCVHVVRDILCF